MQRVFDQLGMRYEQAFDGRKQAQVDAVTRLATRLRPGARVLDVGCATGRPTTEQLCAMGMEVTGTDVSEVMLEHARRQVPRARFVQADLFVDHPELGTYDAVVSFFCLVNMAEERFVEGLRRLAGLAVSGGTVLLAVPERRESAEVPFIDFPYVSRVCRRADVSAWASRAGLDVERVDVVTDPGPRGQEQAGESIFLWAKAPREP